ncbi:hypothetical protein NSS79_02515 [Paenibacillus sp. FSL L8-0436]|uniref:hypothetical protein n=1 Tax=Paenibacillus sp. FSL L8-0436 TaxID=2954686 RepID=UPI0031592055
MRTLLVCYDLINATEDQYHALHQAISLIGIAERVQLSVWTVQTSKSVVQVRDILKLHIRQRDRLFVCEFSAYASINTPPGAVTQIARAFGLPKMPLSPKLPSLNQPINPLRRKI